MLLVTHTQVDSVYKQLLSSELGVPLSTEHHLGVPPYEELSKGNNEKNDVYKQVRIMINVS